MRLKNWFSWLCNACTTSFSLLKIEADFSIIVISKCRISVRRYVVLYFLGFIVIRTSHSITEKRIYKISFRRIVRILVDLKKVKVYSISKKSIKFMLSPDSWYGPSISWIFVLNIAINSVVSNCACMQSSLVESERVQPCLGFKQMFVSNMFDSYE